MAAAIVLVAGCGAAETPAVLLFSGDIMLGRAVERRARDRKDFAFPFRPLMRRLRGAGLTFGNLECVAATTGHPVPFRAHPDMLGGLVEAGFDVVSVANNHAADAGPEALAEMASELGRRGITVAGLRTADGQRPAIVHVHGLRIGVLAYSWSAGDTFPAPGQPAIAQTRREDMVADVGRARPLVDYLVVSLHMGVDLARRSTEGQRQKAHAVLDAGADLVVGHHPHVPQEVERYRGRFIAYSLGDFVFDHPDLSVEGAMLEVTLSQGRPVRLAWISTRINADFQPEATSETRWERALLTGPDGVLD